MVMARAVLPVLSDHASRSEFGLGRRQSIVWSIFLLGAGLFVALAGWVLAPIIVRLMFERGAFTAADSLAVTRVLRFGLVQLPFAFGWLGMVQWLAATALWRDNGRAASGAALKIAADFLFFPAWGLAGLALATAGMYAGTFLTMVGLTFRQHRLDSRVRQDKRDKND